MTQYAARCENYLEDEDRPCDGIIIYQEEDLDAPCTTCGARCGRMVADYFPGQARKSTKRALPVYLVEVEDDGLVGAFSTADAAKEFAESDDPYAPSDYFGKPIVWSTGKRDRDGRRILRGTFHHGPYNRHWVTISREKVQ